MRKWRPLDFGVTVKAVPCPADAAGSRVSSEVTTVSSVTSLRVVVAPESVRVLTAEFTSRVRVAVTLSGSGEGFAVGVDGDDFQRHAVAGADELVDAGDADVNGRGMDGGLGGGRLESGCWHR